MGWADNYIKRLVSKETIKFRPRGGSMRGRIESGQLVTVEPISSFYALSVGDIVLCQVSGHQYLHLIKAIDVPAQRFLIANGRGRENGWTTFAKIYGKVTKVER
jgi:hypothetical protein